MEAELVKSPLSKDMDAVLVKDMDEFVKEMGAELVKEMESELVKSPGSQPAMTMGKRKRSLEENARQSHETTPLKLSRTIMLKCSHPYSSKHIDFKVEPEFCGNGWKYNLDSERHGPHNISRYNPQECFVLTHRKYTVTLKDWLKNTKNKNKWCLIYQRWNVYRPKEEARQIIQGILHAVYELHTDNSFHGFLYHPENFAIYDESVIGSDHEKIKRVFLIHANCELNQHFAAPNSESIEDGKKNDMLAVLDVIFNQIIKYEPSLRRPKDLQKLHELLEQQDVSSHSWKLIVNHPSLWHWKLRFSYIERVRMKFLHAKQSIQNSMRQEFNNIQEVRGWTQRIPPNTPLEKVLHFSNKPYSTTPEELLRYLRNLHVHYRDGWRGDPKYLHGEVIELLATQVSELFLVDLYNIMCKLNMKI